MTVARDAGATEAGLIAGWSRSLVWRFLFVTVPERDQNAHCAKRYQISPHGVPPISPMPMTGTDAWP